MLTEFVLTDDVKSEMKVAGVAQSSQLIKHRRESPTQSSHGSQEICNVLLTSK